jgi:RNA polymerase sigma factor (sigma-70 family)
LSTLVDYTHRDAEVDDTVLVSHALQNGPEAFAPIIERLKDPARLGAWLRTIAIHRCINLLKRRGRLVDFDAIEEPAASQPSPAEELEKSELQNQVMRAVDKLGKTQRETVVLYYIGEYSLAEVAAIQEVPLGTIKRRLHEARKRLKTDMLTMVADVLQDNAPDDAMAERVFELLCAYPMGKRADRVQTWQELAQIGRVGKEGFERSYELPHVLSRNRAVHYVSKKTRKAVVGALMNWAAFCGTPKDAVRKALPVEKVCRAMVHEGQSDILLR